MSASDTVLFHESQYMRKFWFWLFIISVFLIGPIIILVTFAIQNHPEPVSWTQPLHSIGWCLFGEAIGGIALFLMHMNTTVRRDGLYIQWIPFHWWKIRISLDNVTRVEACTYRPIQEYGGWGIQYGPHGMAYNVSGDQGVRLHYEDGKYLLIGSQDPKKLAKAIEKILPEANPNTATRAWTHHSGGF
ncbi:MAG: hypothetical protein GC154_15730 [bacterium]|nr:hypothetical protein [bacterium]